MNSLISLVPTWPHAQLLQYYWLDPLCCTLCPRDYLVTANEYFLIPSPLSPSLLPLWPGNHQFVLCIYEFLFCLFTYFVFLDSIYKRNHVVVVLLWHCALGPSMSSQMRRFTFYAVQYFTVYTCLIFIHLSIAGRSSGFHILAIVSMWQWT